jgi:hypothetical protein
MKALRSANSSALIAAPIELYLVAVMLTCVLMHVASFGLSLLMVDRLGDQRRDEHAESARPYCSGVVSVYAPVEPRV